MRDHTQMEANMRMKVIALVAVEWLRLIIVNAGTPRTPRGVALGSMLHEFNIVNR